MEPGYEPLKSLCSVQSSSALKSKSGTDEFFKRICEGCEHILSASDWNLLVQSSTTKKNLRSTKIFFIFQKSGKVSLIVFMTKIPMFLF